MPTRLFIDADGCPVKDETFRVAARYHLKVFVVANHPQKIPADSNIEMQVVSAGFDAADDWIVEQARADDIIVTSDVLLASRCLAKKVGALSPKGLEWTEDNIGMAVANRELSQNLRYMGESRGGPTPMDKKSRSKFLSQLDQMIQKRGMKNRGQAKS